MCETATPLSERKPCDRCGKCRNPSDRWELDWPNYGVMTLGAASCIDNALTGNFWSDRTWLRDGHPAMTDFGFQEVTFRWGRMRGDNERYRLCYDCQHELLRLVGAFFGIPEHAARMAPQQSSTNQAEVKHG